LSFDPREDTHPITERADLSPERRCQLLEQRLAQLWDQVWWISLPQERRAAYEKEGFRAPVSRFYGDSA
jgi:hypothetical protein